MQPLSFLLENLTVPAQSVRPGHTRSDARPPAPPGGLFPASSCSFPPSAAHDCWF